VGNPVEGDSDAGNAGDMDNYKKTCAYMFYNAETDEYTCHNGKQLKPVGIIHRTSATVYRSEITVYECEDCSDCPHKTCCTKAKGNRKMQVSKTFVEKRQKSYENTTTIKGILLRVNRSIQVEGALGVLKDHGVSFP
jgi:hypothetical protein